MKHCIYIGSWSFRPEKKGLHRMLWDDETRKAELCETILEDIAVGALYPDRETNVLYASDEGGRMISGADTGGVFAIKLNDNGSFGKILSYTASSNPKTSYIARAGKDRLVISNHSSSKAVRRVYFENGVRRTEICYDQSSIDLIALNEDGSGGQVLDTMILESEARGDGRVFPHLHNVMADPSGKMFVTCDKGMDRIITFRIENDRIIRLSEQKTEENTAPRYTAFHPSENILFENNENWPGICSWRYDAESGSLELIDSLLIDDVSYRKPNASDIIIDPSGRRIYAALRRTDEIVVIQPETDGRLTLISRTGCLGQGPRGLYLYHGHLFSMNNASDSITCFCLDENGIPDADSAVLSHVPLPGNMITFRK